MILRSAFPEAEGPFGELLPRCLLLALLSWALALSALRRSSALADMTLSVFRISRASSGRWLTTSKRKEAYQTISPSWKIRFPDSPFQETPRLENLTNTP